MDKVGLRNEFKHHQNRIIAKFNTQIAGAANFWKQLKCVTTCPDATEMLQPTNHIPDNKRTCLFGTDPQQKSHHCHHLKSQYISK